MPRPARRTRRRIPALPRTPRAVVPILGAWACAAGPGALAAQEEPTLTPLEVARVERMLENRIACRGCHVIAGVGGRIGPVLDGLSERVEPAYVRAVLRDAPGTIPGTIMPPQHLPEGDLQRLATYLLALPSREPPPGDARAPPPLEDPGTVDGAALYARHCSACHGADGSGEGWNTVYLPVRPTPHSDVGLMSVRVDDALYDAIYGGAWVLDGSARMPPFGAFLQPEQIRALVAHIRSLCGCAQPAWAGGR